ncbi:MAG: class I SAM-dependent methyltransferase [Acidimicrobiia bacterium]|nr:class I SAM-dependent methyltransferase [Acidimicrobiia bacterium]
MRRFSERSRARRWAELRAGIDWDDVKRVLDLGGKPSFWTDEAVLARPLEITCLNLRAEPGSHRAGQSRIDVVVGDATDPPLDPNDYDLVFSNSVIEHVGGPAAISAFAAVTRQGRQYFVQTPNRWFVVEPHFVLPLHFLLPRRIKAVVVMWWDRGPVRRNYRQALARVDSIKLLTRRELELLFPGATVVVDRKWRLPKSFMVFGGAGDTAPRP